MIYKYTKFIFALFLAVSVIGCDEDEALNQVVVGIVSGEGVKIKEDSTGSVKLQVRLARAVSKQSGVYLTLSSESAQYGVNYTTSPAVLSGNRLRLDFEAGSSLAEVEFSPMVDGIFTGGHTINVAIGETFGEIRSKLDKSFSVVIEESDVPPTIAYFDFENCAAAFDFPVGLEVDSVEGFKADRLWGCTDFGNNDTKGVQVNGFSGSAGASSAWMILDLNSTDNVQGGGKIQSSNLSKLFVEFGAQSFFSGPGTIRLKWSSDYELADSPDEANWTEITEIQSLLPESGSREWKTVFAELAGAAGQPNVHIALQYVDASTGSAASWTVDDLRVLGN